MLHLQKYRDNFVFEGLGAKRGDEGEGKCGGDRKEEGKRSRGGDGGDCGENKISSVVPSILRNFSTPIRIVRSHPPPPSCQFSSNSGGG